MDVFVNNVRDFLVDHGIGAIFLNGEKEVRELMKKLSGALFELHELKRKEVEHGI